MTYIFSKKKIDNHINLQFTFLQKFREILTEVEIDK